VRSHGATRGTGRDLIDWAREAVDRGAGEILLTSIDHDGVKRGFALEMIKPSPQRKGAVIAAEARQGRTLRQVFEAGQRRAGSLVFHFGTAASAR